MIQIKLPFIHLKTNAFSYVIHITQVEKIEHVYFGKPLIDDDFKPLLFKPTAGVGSAILYDRNGQNLNLDFFPSEYSEFGKGDFRLTPLELHMPDGSFVTDFVYHSHEIQKGIYPSNDLPIGKENDSVESLILTLKDTKYDLYLKLIYTLYEDSDVLGRRAILVNNDETVHIRKLMSMMVDFVDCDYDLLSLQGGWIKESHKEITPLQRGTLLLESTTGASSNRVNPGFILMKKGTHEDFGSCYGFNLIYSGNHYEAIQVSNHGMTRVMSGIHPQAFHYELAKGQSFETPEAILTFSALGLNTLSNQFHHFIHEHITPRQFKGLLRPVVINSWEAFFFDFNESKLVSLAKKAKKLGVELFVLDDGWFGNRNDDTSSLGDYTVNLKKLKGGLKRLSDTIHKLGLKFGLWFEPEMISEKSVLYQTHPDWVVKVDGRTPSLGRNQWVLDLTNGEVRNYILKSMKQILNETLIDYIKWDMNRHITDAYSKHVKHPGMFYHEYIKGLYAILKDLTETYPNLWIESCSSGGNRFDLGMLSYTPYVWASDNTDPIERLKIQGGLSYFYPLSTISAHVSLSPHAQTIRTTPLSTRFNVAAMGCLGYELNLKYVTKAEQTEIKHQIELYKIYREVFQQGHFYRFNSPRKDLTLFQVSHNQTHILGFYQNGYDASPNTDVIQVKNLKPNQTYSIESVQQTMPIQQFGHLIAHAIPIKLNPNGYLMHKIGQYKRLNNATESYVVSGAALMQGIPVIQQFSGTYYNEQTRLLGDFGSQIYIIKEVGETHA
ncbi:alpha-galactosidase [Acholeplasma vituli]|uniref:Alpha-galactosidase n=1 Tax=Paracholeplasma vituli TaxID=69473 RepID=A0ABT2PX15_9MOLU|nr:alpha-galactosidase [Paracholeplasma vituli]MCU0105494.1 alpha-galactosidase [Paracholeplasma vituli]